MVILCEVWNVYVKYIMKSSQLVELGVIMLIFINKNQKPYKGPM